ncbi:DUF4367 domain-containing protein [Blautia obeum]|uniref:DUF4367 domain-containing protein n=1 Tax=Blautia obeum TaxID=40520 RepID=A0A414KKV9_9FIRM|nr:DUF4367 domain-containing protein [Blautia obeum]
MYYTANWIYEENSYTIAGKIKFNEIKKLVEYMKF